MRLFLAINLPAEMRRAISDATAALRAAAPDVRWMHESKLHLTMKFLGEHDDSRLEELSSVVRRVTAKHATCDVTVTGIGAFPNSRRPRVLWIGVDRSPRLELLAHDLEVAFQAIGFESEGRAFRPHITIGRIREQPTIDAARALARTGKAVDFEETLSIDSVDLMHSVPGGQRYDLISSAPLSARER
jgi:2'-5' RNA ligase